MIGLWKVPTVRFLASFNYEWTYWQNGIWNSGQSGNVLVENYAKGKMPDRQWATPVYSVPSGVKTVRLRVQTVGEEGASAFYKEGWTDYEPYKFNVEEKKVPLTSITATKMPNTARSFIIEWGLIDATDVASFDYEIGYRLAGSTTYLKAASGNVPADPISRTGKISVGFDKNLSGGKITTEEKLVDGSIWAITYDAPENAYAFHVRVKCNPTYDQAFSSSWTAKDYKAFVVSDYNVVKKVDSITIEWYDRATATLQATISMSSGYSNVASYSVTWEYWHYSENGKGSWFSGSTETVSLSSGVGICTYQVPEESY